MAYEDEGQAFSFIVGIALGTLIGAGVALLVAPQSGRRTRRHIQRVAGDLGDTTRERFDDASEDVRRQAHRAVRGAERRRDRLRETVRRRAARTDE